MVGIGLAGIIHQQFQIPFDFCTAHSDSGTIERARQTFPSGCLLKPFSERELFAAPDIALYYHIRKQRSTMDLSRINQYLP